MSTENVGQTASMSPEQGQGRDPKVPARKRRRPALSCAQCRNRKVKCDRKFPSCDRCIRIGQAHACSYSDDIFSRTGRKDPRPQHAKCDHTSARSNRSRSPKRQVRAPPVYKPRQGISDPATAESLTRAIPAAEGHLMEKHPDTGAAVAEETSTQVIRRSIRNEQNLSCITGSTYLKGNDSQTRFFGQTHPMNMYSQVPFPLSRHTFEESTHSNSLKDFVHISKRSNPKMLHSSTCAQSWRFSNVVARRALSIAAPWMV